ncbi:glycosyltransferase family 39 protein [Bacteroidota bacterium]
MSMITGKIQYFFLSKRNILFISAILLILRLVVSFVVVEDYNTVEDFQIAQNLVNGGGYTLLESTGPTAIKTPVYPLFLTLFIFLFGSSAKIAIVCVQHILFSLVPLLLIKLGTVVGKEKYGYAAGWLFLIHPSYFYYPNVIEVSNIFIPLFIIFLIFAVKSVKLFNKKDVLISSALSGVLILTQPIIIPVIAAYFLYLAIKRRYKHATIMVSIIIVILSPWIIRNYIEFDRLIPSKSPFWMNFYCGWLPYYHNLERYDIVEKEDKVYIDSLTNAGVNDLKMEEYYKNSFVKYIKKYPGIYFEKTIYQMAAYWYVPPRYFNDNRLSFIFVRKVPVVLLNILFIIGIIKLITIDRKEALIIIAILTYFTLVYGLTQTANIRFKLDIEWIEFYAIAALFFSKSKLENV